MKKGVIYILTNPSFPSYVKIGYADDVDARVNQLNSSSAVPFSFHTYATLEVENRCSDKYVHNLIDMMRPELRSVEKNNIGKITRQREFFRMEPDEAYEVLEQIAGLTGGKLTLADETKNETEEKKVAAIEMGKFQDTLNARQNFWTELINCADTNERYLSLFTSGRKATQDHWLTFAAGSKYACISLTVNTRHNGVAAEFYIPNHKAFYAKLEEKKPEIESDLGFECEWQPLEEKNASRIIVRNELGDFRKFDSRTRKEAIDWLIDKLIVMRTVFSKYY